MLQKSTHKFELDTDICVVCGATATEIEDGLIPVECPGAPSKTISEQAIKDLDTVGKVIDDMRDVTRISPEWLRKFDDIEEPSGCPACGLIAGCCQNYPDCPGGEEQKHENGDGV